MEIEHHVVFSLIFFNCELNIGFFVFLTCLFLSLVLSLQVEVCVA
jgi:hypothetical protein